MPLLPMLRVLMLPMLLTLLVPMLLVPMLPMLLTLLERYEYFILLRMIRPIPSTYQVPISFC